MSRSSLPHSTPRRRAESAAPRRRLGEILLAANRISAEDLARALASQFDLPFVSSSDAVPDPAVVGDVPEELARKLRVLPLRMTADGAVLAAVDDPTGLERLEPMAIVLDVELRPAVIATDVLDALLTKGWKPKAPLPPVRPKSRPVEPTPEPEERPSSVVLPAPVTMLQPLEPMVAHRPAADMIEVHAPSSAILPAIPAPGTSTFQVRAADIPGARARLSGLPAPGGTADAAVAVLAAALDVDAVAVELRGEESLTLRWLAEGAWESGPELGPGWSRALAPLLPGPGGRVTQTLVMPAGPAALRCDGAGSKGDPVRTWSLHASNEPMAPDRLGLLPEDLRRMRQWVQGREGIVLVVGPARSGRTTTLRSIARHLLFGRSARWVGPAPIGVPPGIPTSDTIPADAQGALAATARALASNPRVLFVDDVPADGLRTALLAGSEGVLVVAGVRSADAASALSDLRRSGVPDLALSEPLLGIIEQRAIRVLCAGCRQRGPVVRAHALALGMAADVLPPQLVLPGGGCASCRGRTYVGRRVLFTRIEFVGGVTSALGADLPAAIDRARSRRMPEMAASLAAQGVTDLGEIARSMHDDPPPVRGPQVSVESTGSTATATSTTLDEPLPADGVAEDEDDIEPVAGDDPDDDDIEVPMPVLPPSTRSGTTSSIPTLRPVLTSSGSNLLPPWAASTSPLPPVRDDLDDLLGVPRILAVDGSGELGRRLVQAFPGGRATVVPVHRFDEALEALSGDPPDALAIRVVGDGSGAGGRVFRAKERLAGRRCVIVLAATDHRQERELVTAGADLVLDLEQPSASLAERLRPLLR